MIKEYMSSILDEHEKSVKIIPMNGTVSIASELAVNRRADLIHVECLVANSYEILKNIKLLKKRHPRI